jgi:hypothetical protein
MQLRHIVPGTTEWIDAVGADRRRNSGEGWDDLTPEQRLRIRQAQARRVSSAARLYSDVTNAVIGGRSSGRGRAAQSLAGGSASR